MNIARYNRIFLYFRPSKSAETRDPSSPYSVISLSSSSSRSNSPAPGANIENFEATRQAFLTEIDTAISTSNASTSNRSYNNKSPTTPNYSPKSSIISTYHNQSKSPTYHPPNFEAFSSDNPMMHAARTSRNSSNEYASYNRNEYGLINHQAHKSKHQMMRSKNYLNKDKAQKAIEDSEALGLNCNMRTTGRSGSNTPAHTVIQMPTAHHLVNNFDLIGGTGINFATGINLSRNSAPQHHHNQNRAPQNNPAHAPHYKSSTSAPTGYQHHQMPMNPNALNQAFLQQQQQHMLQLQQQLANAFGQNGNSFNNHHMS